MSKKREMYEFYFKFRKYTEKIVVKTQYCKYPEMTKTFKMMKSNYGCGFIDEYGYKVLTNLTTNRI